MSHHRLPLSSAYYILFHRGLVLQHADGVCGKARYVVEGHSLACDSSVILLQASQGVGEVRLWARLR
jgi:hypothetical protein